MPSLALSLSGTKGHKRQNQVISAALAAGSSEPSQSHLWRLLGEALPLHLLLLLPRTKGMTGAAARRAGAVCRCMKQCSAARWSPPIGPVRRWYLPLPDCIS